MGNFLYIKLSQIYITKKGIFLNLFRNLKSDWSQVPGSFCFLIFCPLRGTGFKRKNKGNFLRRFDNALFLKEFLTCNGCFRLFTKIKEGSGTSFLCTFSAWFFIKMFLIQYSIIWTKFHCHNFFPSQDIKENPLFSPYLDNWWSHKLYDLSSIIL